uniref:Uncharacterized protein n=1 Tax=Lepeophtheirus salmonis TaxID=72036 RepID=A0A0K2UKZ0_LEPSM
MEAKIKEDPAATMHHLADEFNVVEITIRRAVHVDFGLKSFVRTPSHLFSDEM